MPSNATYIYQTCSRLPLIQNGSRNMSKVLGSLVGTLRELIAPPVTICFADDWTILGVGSMYDNLSGGVRQTVSGGIRLTVSDEIRQSVVGLERLDLVVSSITLVPFKLFRTPRGIHLYSVAQRLSWAANRRTSRIEDEAYCLMGLLGVNMPLLYGGGTKAFRRLQPELTRQSADETVFAFDHGMRANNGDPFSLLAQSPQAFHGSSTFTQALLRSRHPFIFSNLGHELSTQRAPKERSTTTRKIMAARSAYNGMVLYMLACQLGSYHDKHYWFQLARQPCGHYVLIDAGLDLVSESLREKNASSASSCKWEMRELVEAKLGDVPIYVHHPGQRCNMEMVYQPT